MNIILFLGSYCALSQHQPKLMFPTKVRGGSIQFSPNGKYILNGDQIWDVATGKLLQDLDGEDNYDAQFSPDGNYILTTGRKDTVSVWETQSAEIRYRLLGHRHMVRSANFSKSGQYIITASNDSTAIIWDATSGKLLRQLKGHTGGVRYAQFSPNEKNALTASEDNTYKLWDISSGKTICTLNEKSERDDLIRPQFSQDGKSFITITDNSVNLWDASKGKLIHSLVHESGVRVASLGKKYLVTCTSEEINLWNINTGKIIHKLQMRKDDEDAVDFHPFYYFNFATFSKDEKYLITAALSSKFVIWDIASGKVVRSFKNNIDFYNDRVNISNDGLYLVTSSNRTIVWDLKQAKWLRSMNERVSNSGALTKFSAGPQPFLLYSDNNQFSMLDMGSGKVIYNYLQKQKNRIQSIKLSEDEKYFITQNVSEFQLREARTGYLLHKQRGDLDAAFSNNSRYMATISQISPTDSVYVWDMKLRAFVGLIAIKEENWFDEVQFSPDSKYLLLSQGYNRSGFHVSELWKATGDTMLFELNGSDAKFSKQGEYIVTAYQNSAFIWETKTGKLVHKIETNVIITSVKFLGDSSELVATIGDNYAKIWERSTGNFLGEYQYPDEENYAVPIKDVEYPTERNIILESYGYGMKIFDSDSTKEPITLYNVRDINFNTKIAVVSNYNSLDLISIENGSKLLSLNLIDSVNWVLTHPSGLFDASQGAMEKLYFVQGLDIIQFDQLKDRYYEPGLWKKVIAGEKLRNVVGMKSIDLPPEIQVGEVDEKGYLKISLTNRGGGIGEVNLFINGKEVIKDARDANMKPDAPTALLKVFLGKHKSIVKGQDNLIAVKAWNKDHWVQSRGQVVSYQSKEIESYKPAVHILTCGVSDYTGNEIDLKYAAKDANDMGTALQLGAKKLFGVERSNVYNLTTTQAKESYPTKINILKAFEIISSTAHPLDIFVMYVSGHGINYGGQDGDWHYLTQEAYTGSASAYNDPAIRAQTTISSNELVELFKKVPALKQVLILDACASGKVVDNLMAQKDIESSTLRALDRMRDRTGMHIITGCTADAVSYEASKYGQGVLTYSLLEGIRGAALREDQYVDVNKLFQYAQDRVPKLAEGIGGIQSPQVFSPQGSQSFDIGLLSDMEKKEIPIAKIRPVFIRSTFIDDDQLEDALQLGKKIDDALAEAAAKGLNSTIIFVDVREYPEGCKLSGRYRQEKGIIKLKLRKKCEGIDETIDIDGKTVDEIKGKVLSKLN